MMLHHKVYKTLTVMAL